MDRSENPPTSLSPLSSRGKREGGVKGVRGVREEGGEWKGEDNPPLFESQDRRKRWAIFSSEDNLKMQPRMSLYIVP